MVSRSPISMPWSRIPSGTWFSIVLLDTTVCIVETIPNIGTFATYKAMFMSKYLDRRVFDMRFPYNPFKRAIQAIPPHLRQPGMKVSFKFKKEGMDILLSDWEVLDT